MTRFASWVPGPLRRGLRLASFLLFFMPVPVQAEVSKTEIVVACAHLDQEQAAAFEARARAELLLRDASGHLFLQCRDGASMSWRPDSGVAQSEPVHDWAGDSLLAQLVRLLEHRAPVRTPRPRLGPEARAGTHAYLWNDSTAIGADAGLAWRLPSLTPIASGHLTRALVSYSHVTLYVWEVRAGAELRVLPALTFAAAAGFGGAFATSPSTVVEQQSPANVAFAEGVVSAYAPIRLSPAFELHAGANLALYSRSLQLRVNGTRGFDLRWQPGVFLELAFHPRSP